MYKKRTPQEALEEFKNKKMAEDNLYTALIKFAFNLTVFLPIWLLFFIPFIVVFGIYNQVKPKKKQIYLDITTVAKNLKPQNQRKYDLIMYGATGFTGRQCCLYLAKQYPKLKWAIGGRSQSKLEKIKKELTGIDPALEKNLDIIIADSFDAEQLTKVVEDTRVVISTVGPFADYGSYLVALCAQYGTNYCDITGEFQWVETMIEKYDNLAVQSGARIVSCCGYDCIPSDITTYYLGLEMQKRHQQKLRHSDINNEGYFNPSGGTLLSINRIIQNPPSYKSQYNFQPNTKLTGKEEGSKNRFRNASRFIVGFQKQLKQYVGFSMLGLANANIIQRTNSLTDSYSNSFTYSESNVFPNIFTAFNDIFKTLQLFTINVINPLYNIVGKRILPAPGTGPSESEMDKGYLLVTGFGTGDKGAQLTAQFTLPTDPGYRDTARMLVEAGLSLSLNQDEIKVGGGLFTPGSCQNEVLIKRLTETGATISIKE